MSCVFCSSCLLSHNETVTTICPPPSPDPCKTVCQVWHRQEHWQPLAQGGAAQGLQDRLQAGPDVHHSNVGVLPTTSFPS